jgi:hypothetical protein
LLTAPDPTTQTGFIIANYFYYTASIFFLSGPTSQAKKGFHFLSEPTRQHSLRMFLVEFARSNYPQSLLQGSLINMIRCRLLTLHVPVHVDWLVEMLINLLPVFG